MQIDCKLKNSKDIGSPRQTDQRAAAGSYTTSLSRNTADADAVLHRLSLQHLRRLFIIIIIIIIIKPLAISCK